MPFFFCLHCSFTESNDHRTNFMRIPRGSQHLLRPWWTAADFSQNVCSDVEFCRVKYLPYHVVRDVIKHFTRCFPTTRFNMTGTHQFWMVKAPAIGGRPHFWITHPNRSFKWWLHANSYAGPILLWNPPILQFLISHMFRQNTAHTMIYQQNTLFTKVGEQKHPSTHANQTILKV